MDKKTIINMLITCNNFLVQEPASNRSLMTLPNVTAAYCEMLHCGIFTEHVAADRPTQLRSLPHSKRRRASSLVTRERTKYEVLVAFEARRYLTKVDQLLTLRAGAVPPMAFVRGGE